MDHNHRPATAPISHLNYQDFMLQGRTQSSLSPSTSSPPPAYNYNKLTPTKKGSNQIFNAHLDQWIQNDAQLLLCIRSIANLRERIYQTSRSLYHLQQEPLTTSVPTWYYRAYRTCPSFLTIADLQLLLSDALVQHEHVLRVILKLVGGLDVDALGRHLPQQTAAPFVALSADVYRKQLLIMTLIESTQDTMFYNTNRNDEEGRQNYKVANKCADEWEGSITNWKEEFAKYMYDDY
jgi:hypothetical protein